MNKGCEERCICQKGAKWSCEPRCQGALVQRGKLKNLDNNCFERESSDECCSVVRCNSNDEDSIVFDGGEFGSKYSMQSCPFCCCGKLIRHYGYTLLIKNKKKGNERI